MANTDFFHVSFPGMAELTQSFRTQYQTLQQAHDDLKRQVGASFSLWNGPAQMSYATADAQLSAVLLEMQTVLTMMSTHTAQAHDDWLTTETNNARRLSAI
jgi:WXG100 family type VII secretion target